MLEEILDIKFTFERFTVVLLIKPNVTSAFNYMRTIKILIYTFFNKIYY